jgi:hypothetical protein
MIARDQLIAVPIIVSIVIMPVMPPVGTVPPIFLRMTIIAVFPVIIVRSGLLISRVYVYPKPICFGLRRRNCEQSERH